jgi:outer membrane protein OmpA-like peptidoglycan-associated protein
MINAVRIGVFALCLSFPAAAALTWIGSAEKRLEREEQAIAASSKPTSDVAIAAAANEEYCTPQLKRILRRVLKSCGLLGHQGAGGTTARGCQPVDAKTVATMRGDDFNALFLPMKQRGGIVQFEKGKSNLDDADRALIDRFYGDQRGASYFFVVARASPDGPPQVNSRLSRERAEALMTHLRERFDSPDLEKEVGLLWLGEEYAQLDQTFCSWARSGPKDSCKPEDINRSAFVAWIDCRL